MNLYSTDYEGDDEYEDDSSTSRARKRHAPRKWRSSGFDPKHLKFSHRALENNAEFEIEGNKASDYFRAFFDDELMRKIVGETNNYQ